MEQDDYAEDRSKEAPDGNEPEFEKGISCDQRRKSGRTKPSDRLATRNEGTDACGQNVKRRDHRSVEMRGLVADMPADNLGDDRFGCSGRTATYIPCPLSDTCASSPSTWEARS